MSEEVEPRTAQPSLAGRRIGIYAGVLLVVFLAGLVPMWLKARECSRQLVQSEKQLSLMRTQNNLASAVIDARRGDYEPARQSASLFYTTMRSEVDSADTSNFTPAQRSAVQPLFAPRDEIITLLARSDPASADRLSDLYVSYRKAMGDAPPAAVTQPSPAR